VTVDDLGVHVGVQYYRGPLTKQIVSVPGEEATSSCRLLRPSASPAISRRDAVNRGVSRTMPVPGSQPSLLAGFGGEKARHLEDAGPEHPGVAD
jgi:hypothetical protein